MIFRAPRLSRTPDGAPDAGGEIPSRAWAQRGIFRVPEQDSVPGQECGPQNHDPRSVPEQLKIQLSSKGNTLRRSGQGDKRSVNIGTTPAPCRSIHRRRAIQTSRITRRGRISHLCVYPVRAGESGVSRPDAGRSKMTRRHKACPGLFT